MWRIKFHSFGKGSYDSQEKENSNGKICALRHAYGKTGWTATVTKNIWWCGQSRHVILSPEWQLFLVKPKQGCCCKFPPLRLRWQTKTQLMANLKALGQHLGLSLPMHLFQSLWNCAEIFIKLISLLQVNSWAFSVCHSLHCGHTWFVNQYKCKHAT